jgi:hypothetical protein
VPPVLLRISSWWARKSNSISTAPVRYGMVEVVSPRGLT